MIGKIHLLLVEDDIDLGNIMQQYLQLQQFDVTLCRDGRIALKTYQTNNSNFDLCVIDVMLPYIDGFTLAKNIKKIEPQMPFIFLTAKNQKSDRLYGLQLGADGYITKPFEIDELVLRIRNILKRTGNLRHKVERLGQFVLNLDSLQLQCNKTQQSKRLTQQEAKLLQLLMLHKNKVLHRTTILTQLWGEDDYFAGRSLDVFISRIRKYLKTDKSLRVNTIRGIGFMLTENSTK